MAKAVEQEASQVEELRREARTLTVRKLDYGPCKTVAPLATDGEGRTVSPFVVVRLAYAREVNCDNRTTPCQHRKRCSA